MGSGWINFLIFVLVIGAPAAGSIWKKIEEKKEQRRIEAARNRLRDEQLRTGRVQPLQGAEPHSASPSGGAGATDIDAQRRARLEELRRRQQERLRQAAQARQGTQVRATPSGPSAVSGRTSAPPPPLVQRQPSQRAPQSRPTRTPTRPPVQRSRQAPQRTARAKSPAGKPSASRSTLLSDLSKPEKSRRVELSSPIEAGDLTEQDSSVKRDRTARTRLFGKENPTISDLRRAILLREVFDRPVSMRENPPGSF